MVFCACRSSRSRSDPARTGRASYTLGEQGGDPIVNGVSALWRDRATGGMLRSVRDELPRERPVDSTTARPRAIDRTLALWLVAVSLGAFISTHVLLSQLLAAP